MRPLILASLAGLAAAIACNPAAAQSTVKLTPASGHPNLAVSFTGASFGGSEAVDIYLDTVDTELLVSSPSGSLSGSLTIPAGAAPGVHYITAIGRHSGDAAQASFNVTTPWPQLGFGAAGHGWNPWENTVSTANVASLGAVWSTPTNTSLGSPTVAGGRVFVGTPAGVRSLNAATGANLWTSQASAAFYGSPTIIGSTLYVASAASTALALNTSTGATIWSQALGGESYSSVTVVNGIAYLGCLDDKVYALNASTGAIRWTFTTGAPIYSSTAVVNGVVYATSSDGKIYAINASTGALIWSYATGAEIQASPVVFNGVVYAGSYDNKLYAIFAEGNNSGGLLWSYTTGGAVSGTVAVGNEAVYVGSVDDSIYAIHPRTGALLWKTPTSGSIYGAASLANGVVYIGSFDGSTYALNAQSGAVLWTYSTGDVLQGRIVVSDGVAYLNSYGGRTIAFALQAGNNVMRRLKHAPVISTLHPDFSLRVIPTRLMSDTPSQAGLGPLAPAGPGQSPGLFLDYNKKDEGLRPLDPH